MNRFEYADSRLMPNEVYVRRDMAVRLYDGDTKVIDVTEVYLQGTTIMSVPEDVHPVHSYFFF